MNDIDHFEKMEIKPSPIPNLLDKYGEQLLTRKLPPVPFMDAKFTLQRVGEDFSAINIIFDELARAELKYLNHGQSKDGESLDSKQKMFRIRTHLFHSQVYATVSALIQLCRKIRVTITEPSQLPARSVEAFLNYVVEHEFSQNDQILKAIEIIKKSRDFRTWAVDHPQQQRPWTWMTLANQSLGLAYLIYGPLGFENDASNYFYKHKFVLPDDYEFENERILTSPHATIVYKALLDLATELIVVK